MWIFIKNNTPSWATRRKLPQYHILLEFDCLFTYYNKHDLTHYSAYTHTLISHDVKTSDR